MATGDRFEAVTCIYGEKQNCLNVTHWEETAHTGTGCTLQELADGFSTFFIGSMGALIPTKYSYTGLKWRRVNNTPTASIVSTSGHAAGTRAGNPLPAQNAAVCTLRSTSAPPKTRGRFYCCPAVISDVDADGLLTAAYLTALGTMATFLVNPHTITGAGGTTTIDGIIYHKAAPQAGYSITSAVWRPAFGTQRRRSEINRGDTPAV